MIFFSELSTIFSLDFLFDFSIFFVAVFSTVRIFFSAIGTDEQEAFRLPTVFFFETLACRLPVFETTDQVYSYPVFCFSTYIASKRCVDGHVVYFLGSGTSCPLSRSISAAASRRLSSFLFRPSRQSICCPCDPPLVVE